MSDALVLPAPALVTVPVQGGGLFPVRRIFCVGRNYADHVREMGNDPSREPPIFFTKPTDALVVHEADTPYPSQTKNYHYEMELVLAMQSGGTDIAQADALSHIYGYASGLDMTRRDLQNTYKNAGSPWDMAKAFDHSAPIGAIAPASKIGHPKSAAITLTVNSTMRQNSNIDQLIWSVPEIIAYLSTFVALAAGDLIFTGTPSGVGAVVRGDVLDGAIAGVGSVKTKIV